MNYQEIIKPYLIDFDKLEVGQTLWSVIDGKARVNEFDSDAYPIKVGMFYFTKDGKKHENDKYPTLFTANPFENLQRVVNIGEIKTEKQPFATYDDLIAENTKGKLKTNKNVDKTVEAVIDKFQKRSEVGIKKYGVTLDREDLDLEDWLIHFQEEMQDGILYLERALKEIRDNKKDFFV